MKEILVRTLMSEEVTCLPPDAKLKLAVEMMVEQRYSCIIIREEKRPVGIVTERDLVKVLNQPLEEIDLSVNISQVMSSPVLSVNENDSLFDAMVVSNADKIRHLPVVNDQDFVVGLVTHSDLANAHFRVVEMQTELIEKSVADKTGELQKLNEELHAMSLEDHLMQIGNRRAMEVDLAHTHSAAKRYHQHYSVLLMDIDCFKLYNDFYGHQAGDEALKSVAEILNLNIRKADRLYRYGGEELLLILPNTEVEQAGEVAKKLVSLVARAAIPHEKSTYQILTISCGGADVVAKGGIIDDWKSLVELADKNLYKAKNEGRNRSIVTND